MSEFFKLLRTRIEAKTAAKMQFSVGYILSQDVDLKRANVQLLSPEGAQIYGETCTLGPWRIVLEQGDPVVVWFVNPSTSSTSTPLILALDLSNVFSALLGDANKIMMALNALSTWLQGHGHGYLAPASGGAPTATTAPLADIASGTGAAPTTQVADLPIVTTPFELAFDRIRGPADV